MSQFSFENELNSVLKMDAPITRGPQMRWQRKLNESASSTSRNDSAILNCSSNTSIATSASGKTPMKSANGLPPAPQGVPLSAKTPSKTSLFKTPHKTPGTGSKAKGTPSKGSKTPSGSDRFIPNRSSTQFELGHFLLTNPKPVVDNDTSEENTMSPSQKEFQQAMNENLNGDSMNGKIIAYRNKPPAAPEGYQNNLKVLYSTSKTPGSSKKTSRHIPQVPERILDAPEILDDYYLNLIDWSANNHLAVSLGSQVYLWNASNGEIQQLMEIDTPDEYISSVSWVKEGNFLAVGTSTGEVQIWDVEHEKKLRSMAGHSARVGSLAWNQYVLSSGSRSGYIHHHDVRIRDHQLATIAGHSQEVCGLRWSPDGKYLASGGNDNLLNIWQAPVGSLHTGSQPLHTFTQHQAAVKALAWCPWQPHLLASGGGTADRHIRFWNCNTGSCVQSVDTKSQVCALLWSTEYKELISSHGFAQNQLTIWKYPALTKVAELTGHTARVLYMAMSPDGSTVVSGAADETLRLWKCFPIDSEKKKEKQRSAKKDLSVLLNKQRIR